MRCYYLGVSPSPGSSTIYLMLRSVFATTAAVLMLVSASTAQSEKKWVFNKGEVETYVRHLWVLPSALTVAVGDPKPAADLPGFQEVVIKISQGQASQDASIYISKEGKILQGNIYDINLNPFKKDLDRLKTAFQPNLGTPGASVVLVAFSDMQCPHCKAEAQLIRQNLIQNYPTQVRYYFIDAPIESLHPWAKAAAIGGRCVFRQDPGSFWEYHDWIFGHQESITPDNLKEIVMIWAKDRKDVDSLQLGQCIDSKGTEKEVDAELEEGRVLQIESTPTLFINGRRIQTSMTWPDLKATIDNELEYQKVAKNAGEDCGCDLQLNVPGLPKTGGPVIKKN
jgi:protein-disulfide isomerase